MKKVWVILLIILVIGAVVVYQLIPGSPEKAINQTGLPLNLPEGFSISIFASDLPNARVLAKDPNGVLLVSLPKEGKVIALPDEDNNGVADKPVTVVAGLNRPHGLEFVCREECFLYIAEVDQVGRFEYDLGKMTASNKTKLVDLPSGGNHWTRTIKIFEDKLLISVGSSCNVCNEADWRRAKILAFDFETQELTEFATGLRNAVFMKPYPVTGNLWVTEMGRDLLGDDLPPDEINIVESGKDYGWPICFGKNVHDKRFDKTRSEEGVCEALGKTGSTIDLQAHSAPLGLDFFPNTWPKEYQGDLLVAYHGSWNRTVPTGYKIMRFDLETGNLKKVKFIDGWLQGNEALGRPVDILINENQTIYISDDAAGVVYLVKLVN